MTNSRVTCEICGGVVDTFATNIPTTPTSTTPTFMCRCKKAFTRVIIVSPSATTVPPQMGALPSSGIVLLDSYSQAETLNTTSENIWDACAEQERRIKRLEAEVIKLTHIKKEIRKQQLCKRCHGHGFEKNGRPCRKCK